MITISKNEPKNPKPGDQWEDVFRGIRLEWTGANWVQIQRPSTALTNEDRFGYHSKVIVVPTTDQLPA